MFANFTEETCTGTGATLALAGATSGNLAFSESFADGDLVAYVLEDSGGSIKVAGVGTYVSATDDITRNDTWNYNGTSVDTNPSTNITLSGGTHTVRCDLISHTIRSRSANARQADGTTRIMNGVLNSDSGASNRTLPNANDQIALCFRLMEDADIASIAVNVRTADASGSAEMGISNMDYDNGIPESSYIASGSVDVTTTGEKTVTVNKFLKAGYYFIHFCCDSATVAINGGSGVSGSKVSWTPLKKGTFARREYPILYYSKTGVGATLDADPSTVTGVSHATTSESTYLFILKRS